MLTDDDDVDDDELFEGQDSNPDNNIVNAAVRDSR